MQSDSEQHEYRCPGQDYPISRAVHLARMAGFYPGCRTCPHGDDTDGLSRRVAGRVRETRERAEGNRVGENADKASLFFAEGAAGVYLNDIGPEQARRMAAALGIVLRESPKQDDAVQNSAEPPVAMVAGDGRPFVPELVAAVAEGLRWSGCHVVDIGQASAPCTAFAVKHFKADGGILVGNPGRRPHCVGLKFWAARGMPLSMGEGRPSLDDVQRVYEAGPSRPCRKYGSLRRLQVEDEYLATLAEYYHALRPLRVLLDCSCRPLVEYLQRLTGPLACEIICQPTASGEAVGKHKAHLGVSIECDGETCTVFNERGQEVEMVRLAELIGRHLLSQDAGGAVVLEHGVCAMPRESAGPADARHEPAGQRRARTARAMRDEAAVFGCGRSGRFWYASGGVPLPDALRTVTLLLEILSQSDQPLSSVLDE